MANAQDYGLFIATNYIFDVAQLQQVNVNSPEFKELLVRLYQNINSICIALNLKDSGYYNTQEFINGQMWFPSPALNSTTAVTPTFRQVYRQVVNFGILPNAVPKAVNHNIPINTGYSFTRIYATASDPAALTYIPIPYVDVTTAGAADIQLDVTATQVIITPASNRVNYTICYVILEYIKN